jgi:diguanylate cyclase (GGDEF)-like protein/PAS domain S-box-containing protein
MECRKNAFQWIYDINKLFILVDYLLFPSFSLAEYPKPFIDKFDFPMVHGSAHDGTLTDNKGMLWLGTTGGYLNRYNGSNESSEMSINFTNKTHVDAWNRIWSKTLSKLYPQSGFFDLNTFQEIPVQFLDSKGKTFNTTMYNFIMVNSDYDLWIMNQHGDIFHAKLTEIIGKKVIVERITNIDLLSNSLKDTHLYTDSLKNLWVINDRKVKRFDFKTKVWHDFSNKLKLDVAAYWSISTATLNHNEMWLTARNYNKLFRIDNDNNTTSFYIPHRIMSLVADPIQNKIWIATSNGLYFVEGSNTEIKHYDTEAWQDAGLKSPVIRHLHLDSLKNVWITSNQGIQVLRSLHRNVKRITPELYRPTQQKPNIALQVILGLIEENEHTLWWFNLEQELVRYDSITGQEKVFPIEFPTLQKGQFDQAKKIYYNAPFIFITTVHSNNILKFDIQKQKFLTPINLNNNEENSIEYLKKKNNIWLSKVNSIEVHDKSSSSHTTFQHSFNYWNNTLKKMEKFSCIGLNTDIIYGIRHYYQYNNIIWASVLNASNSKIIRISLDNNTCDSLDLVFDQELVYAALQNEPESIWLIQGDYVRNIKLSDNSVLYSDRIPLNTVDNANIDEQGNILIYGDGTLWHFSVLHRTWTPLFASDVSLGVKSRIWPFFNKKSNIFYILSHQGIITIDTKNTPFTGKPKAIFTSLKIGMAGVKKFHLTSNIAVPYGETVNVNYTSTPIVPAKLLRYRYRLNSKKPWVYTGNNESLLFTQLPSGSINLELQATFNNKNYGKSDFLKFTISTPWWRTYTSYLIYVALFILLSTLILSWQRTRQRLRTANLTVSVFKNTTEGLCVLSEDFSVLQINEAMSSMVGWTMGQNVESILAQYSPNKNEGSIKQITTQLLDVGWQGDLYLENPNKVKFLAELRINRLKGYDVNKSYVLVAEDITDRKKHENELFYLSRHDHLTQLPNRLFFDEYISELIDNISPLDHHALIMLDLDNFKTINDGMGHNIGDLLLKKIADDFTSYLSLANFSKNNLVARHSGDEFLISIQVPKDKNDLFEHWLIMLLDKISQQKLINSHDISITASAGVTFLSNNTQNPTVLLQQADMAMYKTKLLRKGSFTYFTDDMNKELQNKIELENQILRHGDCKGLEIDYQPKIDVNSGKIVGIEALSRWRLLSNKRLSPGEFLPLISSDRMDQIFSLAVARHVCRDFLNFKHIVPNIKMSINISPRNLKQMNYLNELYSIIIEYKISPSDIILEILEDVGIDDASALANIKKIHSYGIGISIDDFGTGYSSLSHLNKLYASELKIDKSFLTDIENDLEAVKLFTNIVKLGKQFDMVVICEGVETQKQLEFVRAQDCDHYQGYYFSKPVSAEKFIDLLIKDSKNEDLE